MEVSPHYRPQTTITTNLVADKAIPFLAAAWLQRLAILLFAHHYDICFHCTEDRANAMGCLAFLWRFLLYREELSNQAACFNLGQFQSLPVTSSEVATATRQGPILSEVLLYAQQGWSAHVPESMQPFSSCRHELTWWSPSIVGKSNMIIPLKLCTQVLQELHQGHGGIVRKSLARSYFWWPGFDKNDEGLFKPCQTCMMVKSAPSTAPLHLWVWPEPPWQWSHIVFMGPFNGQALLLLVNARSKWPDSRDVIHDHVLQSVFYI